MYKINLSKSQQKELKSLLKRESKSKVYKRLQFINYEANQGKKRQEIARLLDVRGNTLTEWAKLFCQGGFKELCTFKYDGRRTSKLTPIKEQIETYLEDTIVNTLDELNDWIKEKHSVSIVKSGLWTFLKKNGLQLQTAMA